MLLFFSCCCCCCCCVCASVTAIAVNVTNLAFPSHSLPHTHTIHFVHQISLLFAFGRSHYEQKLMYCLSNGCNDQRQHTRRHNSLDNCWSTKAMKQAGDKIPAAIAIAKWPQKSDMHTKNQPIAVAIHVVR